MTRYLLDRNMRGSGTFVNEEAGEALGEHKLVYRGADGLWYLADADLAATMPALGITMSPIAATRKGWILRDGYIGDITWAWTGGDEIYASTTPGELTQTLPAGPGDIVQIVAVAIDSVMIDFRSDLGLAGGGFATVMGYRAAIGQNIILQDIPNYFYTADGLDCEEQWNLATAWVVANAPNGIGAIKWEGGDYEVRTTTTDLMTLVSGISVEGEGDATYIKIADGQPDTIAGDWVYQTIFSATANLIDVKLSNMKLDGNKANQTHVNASRRGAPVYADHSGNNLRCEGLHVLNGETYGIFFTANGGDLFDVHVHSCRVFGNGFNDISFQTGVHTFYDSSMTDNISGGDTGDISLDVETFDGGTLTRILIDSNIIQEMTGINPLNPKNWYAIRIERGTTGCTASNNICHETMRGISEHEGSSGGNLYEGNIIFLSTTEADAKGMVIEADGSSVIDNYVFGDARQAGNYGLSLTGDNIKASVNHLASCEYGALITGDHISYTENQHYDNTQATRVTGDDNKILNNQYLSDATGILTTGTAERTVVLDNEFDDDVTTCMDDNGVGTMLAELNMDFKGLVGGAALDTTAPCGIDIDADTEGAFYTLELSPDVNEVTYIRVVGVAIGNMGAFKMRLQILANAGKEDEAYNAEAIAVVDKNCDTTVAVNDIVKWTFTSSDDDDIDDLSRGDNLSLKVMHEGAGGNDAATDFLCRDVIVGYV